MFPDIYFVPEQCCVPFTIVPHNGRKCCEKTLGDSVIFKLIFDIPATNEKFDKRTVTFKK